jgi:surface polysaccharide O-acyltransferase-like enzyme
MWLDSLRVTSILAVVLLHVSSVYVLNHAVESEEWIAGNFIDAALRWCVPVFVMISGAFLLDSSKNESIFEFYRKRLNKIIIPLVFWSSFYAAWRLFRGYISTGSVEIVGVFTDAINGEAFYHLWFLFMILGMYAFTPFFRVIVKGVSASEYTILVFLLCVLCISSSVFY